MVRAIFYPEFNFSVELIDSSRREQRARFFFHCLRMLLQQPWPVVTYSCNKKKFTSIFFPRTRVFKMAGNTIDLFNSKRFFVARNWKKPECNRNSIVIKIKYFLRNRIIWNFTESVWSAFLSIILPFVELYRAQKIKNRESSHFVIRVDSESSIPSRHKLDE